MHALVAVLVLFSSLAWAQTPCTSWASPTGQGVGCTQAQPCKVSSWWPLAGPGKTLCLKSGEYRGTESMIHPPATLRGTEDKPITVRAEHDGAVLLDAQHASPAVALLSSWFVVEGVNASNGLQRIYGVSGAYNTLRRTIGWDGTAGQDNSFIYDVVGTANRVEDSAGWGVNARKIFNASQAGDAGGGGFRRTWGEFNGHPLGGSGPSNTYQFGYNTTNQLWENVIGTWDLRGNHKDAEGALGAFYNGSESGDMAGSRILGAIMYAAPGTNYSASKAVQSVNMRGMYYENLLAYIAPEFTSKWPFFFYTCAAGACSGSVCKDCMSIHAGAPSVNQDGSGWSLPGFREGRGVEAATGGESVFTRLLGLCKRYKDGVLSSEPLWPWAMNQRIKDARVQSGYPSVDVTETIERLLGPIPAACKAGTAPPEPPIPPAGATPLACVGLQGESGGIAIACQPQPAGGRR